MVDEPLPIGQKGLDNFPFDPEKVSLEFCFERYVTTKREDDWNLLLWKCVACHNSGVLATPQESFIKKAARWMPPKRLLSLFVVFDEATRQTTINVWTSFLEELRASEAPQCEAFRFAARHYLLWCSKSIRACLKDRFAESSNAARYRGDAYITVNGNFYFNYRELCGETGYSRQEAMEALEEFEDMIRPNEAEEAQFGGKKRIEEIVNAWAKPMDGRDAATLLPTYLDYLDLSCDEILSEVPNHAVRELMLKFVAAKCDFEMDLPHIQEIYEVDAIIRVFGSDLAILQKYVTNFYADPKGNLQPDDAWLKAYEAIVQDMNKTQIDACLSAVLGAYARYSQLVGEPCVRLTAVWQASHLNSPPLAEALCRATTCRGSESPIHPLSLIHKGVCAQMLKDLVTLWKNLEKASEIHWTSADWNLILRYFIGRQCAHSRERLIDLFLRGGGYDEGETYESVSDRLENLFHRLELSPSERAKLHNLRFDARRLSTNINVFNGDEIDTSEWASSSTAFKYVKTLLKLSGEPRKIASYLSEKRAHALERFLLRHDISSSHHQIISAVDAFEDPEDALAFLILLTQARAETPSDLWLSQMKAILAKLNVEDAKNMLIKMLDDDSGEQKTSLNPGLMWAMRFVADETLLMQLARTVSDAGSYGVIVVSALIDTLNSMTSRSSLLAILQLQRRLRNTRLMRHIQKILDDIANRDGLECDIFLDYSVDTCELDANASVAFNFVEHTVTLSLGSDGQVNMTIQDRHGRVLRNVPKSTRECHPDIYATFQNTKRILSETVEEQKKRLARAVKSARKWNGGDFIEIFMRHPLMSRLGQNLVWCPISKQNENILHPFIKKDSAWVDINQNPVEIQTDLDYELLDAEKISSQERDAWLNYLAQNQIVQPFDQFKIDSFLEKKAENIAEKRTRRKKSTK